MILVYSAGSGGLAVENTGNINSLFFKVKKGATPGSEIRFSYFFDVDSSSSSISIGGKNVKFNAEDAYVTVAGPTVVENNKLSNISAKGTVNGTQYDYMEGIFNETQTAYEFAVPSHVTTMSFDSTLEVPGNGTTVTHGKTNDLGVSVSGMALTTGDNYFQTVVKKSNSETAKIYTYKIRRLSSSTDVVVGGLDNNMNALVFTDKKTTVLSNATSVDVSVDTKNSGAQYVVFSGEPLLEGNNVKILTDKLSTPFSVNIKPEDSLDIYNNVKGIDYLRGVEVSVDYLLERASDDTSLSSLVLKNSAGGAILKTWNETLDTYEFDIPNDVSKIDLDFTPNNEGAKTMNPVTNLAMNPGMNEFKIQVNAADGTQKFYTFKINRIPKNNAELSSLSVKVNGVEKTANINTVLDLTKITLEYAADYTATIFAVANTLEGASLVSPSDNVSDSKLVVGDNHFTVRVKAQDGITTKNYSINILVKPNSNSVVDGGIKVEPPVGDDNWLENPEEPIKDNTVIDEKDPSDPKVSIYRYTVDVLNKKKTFSMSDLNVNLPDNAILSGGTQIPLLVGPNEFQFEIKSQDGSSTSRYIITVNRAQNDVASVDSITLTSNPQGALTGNLTDGFTYKVPENVFEYSVQANVADGDGSVVDPSTIGGPFPLTGNMNHVVKVTSEDGKSFKEYTIKIERAESIDSSLSELLVSYGALIKNDILASFSNQVYTLNVDNDVSTIDIFAKTTHPKANFTINGGSETNFELAYGETKFSIVVSAENGSVSNYTLKVMRALKSDANLSSLSVGGSIVDGFGSNILSYDLGEVDENTHSLDITYVLSDSLATAKILGNNLAYGPNVVQVVVTAQDGITIKSYELNVNRALSSSPDLGTGGIKPGLDRENDIFEEDELNPYIYTVYVPFGTKTYGKTDFLLDLTDGSTVVYDQDSIDLKTKPGPGENVFKFTVTAPNGVGKQEYIINVVITNSLLPELVSISINDVIYSAFSPAKTDTIINLDSLIAKEDETFKFSVVGPEGVSIAPSSFADIEVKGLSIIDKVVSVTNLNSGMIQNYKFKFTRSLTNDNTLKDIIVNEGTLTPSFEEMPEGPFEVTVGSDTTSVTLNPELGNPNSTVTGGGRVDLVPGKNTITIKVTPEDNSPAKDYVVNVYRELELKELALGSHIIDVKGGVKSLNQVIYTIVEPFSSDEIEAFVKAVANDPSVTISGQANKNVVLDNTDIELLLTARDNETKLKVIIKYTRTLNGDASLKDLTLKGVDGTLKPVFSPDQSEYTLDVEHDFLELIRDTHLTWTSQHPNTTVSAPEKMILDNKIVNRYVITSKAEDGTEKEYYININRGTYNALENLSIKAGDGHFETAFDKDTLNYTALVYSGASSFSFDWSALPGVSVTNEGSLRNIPTGELPKTFEIIVKGDSDKTRTYTVDVALGVSTRLESMSSSLGILEFDKDKLEYEVLVSNEATSVSLINVIPEDKKAQVVGEYTNIPLTNDLTGPIEIVVKNSGYETKYSVSFRKIEDETAINKVIANDGPNRWESTVNDSGDFEILVNSDTQFEDLNLDVSLVLPGGKSVVGAGVLDESGNMKHTITVTDKNGIVKDYNLFVIKDASDNNFLKSLTIFGKPVVGFNRWATEYEYELTDDKPFVIEGIAEDEKAEVSYSIDEPLIDGSVVLVTVVSPKGTAKTYKITINKVKKNTAILESLSIKEMTFSPSFSPTDNKYYLTIPNELSSLTVNYVAADGGTATITSNASVELDNVVSNLIVGDNTIDINVKAQDGTEFTYTIFVKRSPASNNYLKALSVKGTTDKKDYALSPLFSKEKLSYIVEIPRDMNEFTVYGSFDESLRTYGLEDIVIPQFPYIHEVKVVDALNISRSYTITFIQEASEVITLANLWTNVGALNPVFNANKFSYTMEVPYSVKNMELLYETNAQDQVVTGAGFRTLKPGLNTFEVKVSSGTNTQTYTVIVNRAVSSVASLDWLEVSGAVLDPVFDRKLKEYRVEVEPEIDTVTINAGSNSEAVTITGNGEKSLQVGSNVFEITVDAGAGVVETYFVVINRGPVENLLLAHLSIRDESLKEAFSPDVFEYSSELSKEAYPLLDVIAIAQNPNATVKITGNLDLGEGESLVTVRVSTSELDFQDTQIRVSLGLKKIKSHIHEVGETYIATIKDSQTVKDVKDQMLNANEDLKVYSEGLELQDTDLVGTGAIIKLVIAGVEYDAKTIVVLGDVNGDGEISIADRMKTQSHVLGNLLIGAEFIAADVTKDGVVSVADYMMIQANVLGLISIHNPKEAIINE